MLVSNDTVVSFETVVSFRISHMHHCAIDDQLHDRGLKKTHSRHRIIELFYMPRLWSFDALQHKLHDISRATIYRNIQLMLRENFITKTTNHRGEELFELTQDHHDHLACKKCHTTSCLPCPIPTIKQHTLELQGVCTSCSS